MRKQLLVRLAIVSGLAAAGCSWTGAMSRTSSRTVAIGSKGSVSDSPLSADCDAADGFEAAFQANSGSLWTVGSAGDRDWALGMMARTSPVIATVGGGFEVAFQANSGSLWTVGSAGDRDWALGMMAGTSPTMTALPGGGFEVAFQASNGSLWTVGSAGDRDWALGMMRGTSPTMTALPGGGFEVGFQANSGSLWTVGSGGDRDWALGMMAGTSPVIASMIGGFEVAFQANNGSLWTVGSAGNRDWALGMMAGTSPVIAAGPGEGFEVAFQANSGSLWTVGSAGNEDWALGMMAGTSPSLSFCDPLAARAALTSQWADGRAGIAGFTVINLATDEMDEGGSAMTQIRTASVIKVPIAMALMSMVSAQGRTLTPAEQTELRLMITQSDNNAATELWNEVGGANVISLMRSLGATETLPDPGGAWGFTLSTSRDLAVVLAHLADGFPGASAADEIVSLMRQVIPSQAWGIGAAIPGAAIKNGWYPDPDDWRVNCLGIADGYALAIMTQYPIGLGQGYGEATCQQIAADLLGGVDAAQLAPRNPPGLPAITGPGMTAAGG